MALCAIWFGGCGRSFFRGVMQGDVVVSVNRESGHGSCPLCRALRGHHMDHFTRGGGAAASAGTVFSYSTALGPFVKTLPAFGKAGASVTILGTDLTGASSVSFNGAAAIFEVVSNSEIKTTVPDGATTGTVQVVTPGGALSSNARFHVR
jgi:hypothetical protein